MDKNWIKDILLDLQYFSQKNNLCDLADDLAHIQKKHFVQLAKDEQVIDMK